MKTLCFGCMQEYDDQFKVCPHCGYNYKPVSPWETSPYLNPGTFLDIRYIVGKVAKQEHSFATYIGWDNQTKQRVLITEYLSDYTNARYPGHHMIACPPSEIMKFSQAKQAILDDAGRIKRISDNEGICRVLDYFEANGTVYIVREYVEGNSLNTFLRNHGRLTPKAALSIILPLTSILEMIHQRGLIHHNISPSTIMIANPKAVSEPYRVKLSGFDLMYDLYSTSEFPEHEGPVLYMPYAPLEFFAFGKSGFHSDVYSLAAVFYRMLTGNAPALAVDRLAGKVLPRPSELGVTISPTIEKALMHALAVKPEDRTQSMAQFAEELCAKDSTKKELYEKDEKTLLPLPQSHEESHLKSGTVLNGRYIIEQKFGFAGFGIIYIAWDNLEQCKVEIDEFLPNGLATRIPGTTDILCYSGTQKEEFDHGLERFLTEAKLLKRISNNEGIIRVFDYFISNNTAYIVRETFEGKILAYFLKEHGPLRTEDALPLILQLASALEKMHQCGVIHLELRPNEIYIQNPTDALAQYKLKLYVNQSVCDLSTVNSKTSPHSIILAPGYAAPECYRGTSKLGPYTNVYALAAIFYRMITGRVPEESINRQVEDTLVRPSELGVEIHESTENALMNALNLDPKYRTQTMAKFAEELCAEKVKYKMPANIRRKKILQKFKK